jgi:hypothetical protein
MAVIDVYPTAGTFTDKHQLVAGTMYAHLRPGRGRRDRLRDGRGQGRRGWRRAWAMLMTAMTAQSPATRTSCPVLTELVVVITDPCKGPD